MLTDILPEIEKSVLDTEPDGVFLLPAMPKGSYRVINEGSGFVPLSWKILASVDTQVHEQVERVELSWKCRSIFRKMSSNGSAQKTTMLS